MAVAIDATSGLVQVVGFTKRTSRSRLEQKRLWSIVKAGMSRSLTDHLAWAVQLPMSLLQRL